MGKTKIEWTDAVWNPTTGCNKISPGCKHCYAKRDWARLSQNSKTVYFGRQFEDVQTHPERLETPLNWKKPRRIFVNSMSDLFHEAIPFEFVDKVFAVMALAPRHIFQVLTKRADRMRQYLKRDDLGMAIRNLHASAPDWARNGANSNRVTLPLPNVWLGVSVENQEQADKRIPTLLQTPATVRFLSCEPLLSEIDLRLTVKFCGGSEAVKDIARDLHWVITGGESGPNARPSHPDWFRSIRDQCVAVGVPHHFKQFGNWWPISQMPDGYADTLFHPAPEQNPEAIKECKVKTAVIQLDGTIRDEYPHGAMLTFNVGKKAAGRLLDGRTWDQFPEVSQ